MKEKILRKIIREEIKNIYGKNMPTQDTPQGREDVISTIYQWIMQGDMKKAMLAMKNDPELMKLANNVDLLKKELIRRMNQSQATYDIFADAIDRIKKRRGIK